MIPVSSHSAPFMLRDGTAQGDLLSSFLFNCVMEIVMTQHQQTQPTMNRDFPLAYHLPLTMNRDFSPACSTTMTFSPTFLTTSSTAAPQFTETPPQASSYRDTTNNTTNSMTPVSPAPYNA
jgi:hypothetical protein